MNSKTVTVNKDVWAKLPDEVKNLLQDVAVEYRDHIANMAMNRAAASLEKYKASGGTVVELSAEARTSWAKSTPNIAVEWAASLDKKGRQGSDMLKAYMAKMKAAGRTPVRDWAAELIN